MFSWDTNSTTFDRGRPESRPFSRKCSLRRQARPDSDGLDHESAACAPRAGNLVKFVAEGNIATKRRQPRCGAAELGGATYLRGRDGRLSGGSRSGGRRGGVGAKLDGDGAIVTGASPSCSTSRQTATGSAPPTYPSAPRRDNEPGGQPSAGRIVKAPPWSGVTARNARSSKVRIRRESWRRAATTSEASARPRRRSR